MPWYSYFKSAKKNNISPTDTNDWCVLDNNVSPFPDMSHQPKPILEIPLKVDPKPHVPIVKSSSANNIQKISSLKTNRLSQSIDPDVLAGKISKRQFFHNIIRKIIMPQKVIPATNTLPLQVVPDSSGEVFNEIKIDIPTDLSISTPPEKPECGCLRFFSWLRKLLICQ